MFDESRLKLSPRYKTAVPELCNLLHHDLLKEVRRVQEACMLLFKPLQETSGACNGIKCAHIPNQ